MPYHLRTDLQVGVRSVLGGGAESSWMTVVSALFEVGQFVLERKAFPFSEPRTERIPNSTSGL